MKDSLTVSSKQQGVSLIEVLVAAVIIAIGLLGLAGLQTRSMQMNQSAHFRSQANYYAYEIVDAMRLNRSAAEAGNYDFDLGDGPPGDATLADADLSRWIRGIRQTLPMTNNNDTGGSITVNNTPSGLDLTVVVAWQDERWNDDQNDQVRNVTIQTEL